MAAQDNMAVWRDCIRAWYPDYETKPYFVPPVVITRIPFDVVSVAGRSVLVPQCNPDHDYAVQPSSTQVKVKGIQESDTREDLALQRVSHYFRKLTREQSEPMFVISQLKYSAYLGEPCYAAAAKQFLRPHHLSKDYRRGDFDILVIHRHYGIITGEIKSVLSNQQQLQLSQPDVDRFVAEKVKNAIKTLKKSDFVLREITKDIEPNLAIRKILILPYVTADVLKRVVSSNEQLKQDLVTCLQAIDVDEAFQYCLLTENLSSSGTEMVSGQQLTWWSTFTAKSEDKTRTSEVYLELLARFCGPATTVSVYCPTSPRIEIRTEGQGVAVTGERMTSLVLTPEQVSLLTRAPPKVLLTGPPGVGKSVMLVLMALTWLRQGHDVHLVSVWVNSLAITRKIHHMIEESKSDDPITSSSVGSVHLLEYNFYRNESDVDKAINKLTAQEGSHGPYVINDEFWVNDRNIDRYNQFVTDLCTHLPNVYLWAASIYFYQRPKVLQEERMTIPLRCPPAVLIEVQEGINRYSDQVHLYTTTALATPCDGPNVIHLNHQGPEHAGRWPLECAECGKSIAGILKRLRLGVIDSVVNPNTSTATKTASTDDNHTNNANIRGTTALSYRDVFVLTRSLDVYDDVMDMAGFMMSQATGVVRGLRSAGIPVRVIRTEHESEDLRSVENIQNDVVTVTHCGNVSGLERKVVVWLPGRIPKRDDHLTDEQIEAHDRLHAMSRCTAQLVVVDVPRI